MATGGWGGGPLLKAPTGCCDWGGVGCPGGTGPPGPGWGPWVVEDHEE